MAEGPLQRYRNLAAAGLLEADPAQALAAEKLQLLHLRLAAFKSKTGGLFSSFFSKSAPVPKGLYLFGGVGRGKTMLMDLFFDSTAFTPKRRAHFNEFMTTVHGAIADYRRSGEPDPIPHVAQDILPRAQRSQPRLLCLDELQINDITDAMIVARLFKALFADGLVLVATSNQPPRDLYKDGINRDLFLPFIDLIESHTEVIELEARRDYRRAKLAMQPAYFTPLDAAARTGMAAAWQRLTEGSLVLPAEIAVGGRVIKVPAATCGVARFDFKDLCSQPFAAHDYLQLAERFHTILIDNIPVMGPERRDEARRFMTLIDILYDRGVKLIVSAAAEPDQLYQGKVDVEAFQRTASRLLEMRSKDYLEAPRKMVVNC